VLLIGSALVLGFLHGLGADHLMAIAALSVRGDRDRSQAFAIAVRFAAGHALVLALGATVVILLGWAVPEGVERGGEVLGGLLLIALGVVGMWAAASGRVYAHAHPYATDPGAWHLHFGGERRAHSSAPARRSLPFPAIFGAIFAVSSLRALSTLAPFGGALAASLPLLLVLVALFAVGILISMSLFGVALARTLSSHLVERLGRGAAFLMGAASMGLGTYWVIW
jgi:nickel/cobalt transporter (NicO) family protein